MNLLAYLASYRWVLTAVVVLALFGGAWRWHESAIRTAVKAQYDTDQAVLRDTVQRLNDAADKSKAQAQVESAQRAQVAQEKLRELQTAQAAVAARATSLTRQLHELRAAQGQCGGGVPQAAAPGQSAEPRWLRGLLAPANPSGADPDSIDRALMARLTQAEQLRQSCLALWAQAQADRKGK